MILAYPNFDVVKTNMPIDPPRPYCIPRTCPATTPLRTTSRLQGERSHQPDSNGNRRARDADSCHPLHGPRTRVSHRYTNHRRGLAAHGLYRVSKDPPPHSKRQVRRQHGKDRTIPGRAPRSDTATAEEGWHAVGGSSGSKGEDAG